MPSTYRVALGMVEAHILWTFIVAVAAVGSFIVLESVTAPNGTSYRAIYCIADMDFDSRDNAAVSSGSGCVCNGEKISNVSNFLIQGLDGTKQYVQTIVVIHLNF